jgi:hypothetical protein
MDKIAQYQQIIEKVLRNRSSLPISNSPGAEGHLVIDPEKREYVLLRVGWSGPTYKHGLMFHIEIKGDKVWIHEDRTDIDLAGLLIEEGIPKSHIVLGFVAPYARESSGFAAA